MDFMDFLDKYLSNIIAISSIVISVFFTVVNLRITIKYSSFSKLNNQKSQLLAKRDDIAKIISLLNELWHFESYMQDVKSSQLNDIEQEENLILRLHRLTTQFYIQDMKFTYVDPIDPIHNINDLIVDLRNEALLIDEELKNRLIKIDEKLLPK